MDCETGDRIAIESRRVGQRRPRTRGGRRGDRGHQRPPLPDPMGLRARVDHSSQFRRLRGVVRFPLRLAVPIPSAVWSCYAPTTMTTAHCREFYRLLWPRTERVDRNRSRSRQHRPAGPTSVSGSRRHVWPAQPPTRTPGSWSAEYGRPPSPVGRCLPASCTAKREPRGLLGQMVQVAARLAHAVEQVKHDHHGSPGRNRPPGNRQEGR